MQICVVSDIHGNVSGIHRLVETLDETDLILVAGDIGKFNHPASAEEIITCLSAAGPHLCAVAGNCDPAGLTALLDAAGVGVDAQVQSIHNLQIAGLERRKHSRRHSKSRVA